MSQKELVEEIEDLRQTIEYTTKRIKRMEERDSDKQLITEQKCELLNLQRNLLEAEQELKITILKEIEEKINNKTTKSDRDIERERDINKYITALNEYGNMQGSKFDLQIAILNEYSLEHIQRYQEKFESDKQSYKQKMESFVKTFTLHQKNQGEIDEEQRKILLDKEDYDIKDMNSFFSSLTETDKIEEKKQFNDVTVELVESILPKSDIKGISKIDDAITEIQLKQLYQVQQSTDIEIYAIHSFDNHTLGEVSGMSREGFSQFIGGDYDMKIGDRITLCMFNSKTGQLEIMQNNDITPQRVSEENNVQDDNLDIKDVIGTFSYAGLNLTFYDNPDGKLCIARNTKEGMKEIPTDSLEQMKKLHESQEKISKLMGTDSLSNAQNADDMHRKAHSLFDYVENLKQQMAEIERNTSLDEKEDAQRHEKLDREKLDSKRRLI